MTNYAPVYFCPDSPDSPVIYSYPLHQEYHSYMRGWVKIKVDVRVASQLAAMSAYPDAVKTAVLKQIAFAKEISLEQTRILLGWAAQKAMGYKVTGLRNDIGV